VSARFVCMLVAIFLVTSLPAHGTSIVVLANKTQIAVAADSAENGPKGGHDEGACKIFKFRNFFFVMAGAVKMDEIQSLAEAAQGTNNLIEIRRRFNQLVRKPLENIINYRLTHIPNYVDELRKSTQVFQIIMFKLNPTGPLLLESLFPYRLLKNGQVRIDEPNINTCKDGDGECSLIIGEGDKAREFVAEHPLKGQDLVADAANLVRIEAGEHSDIVGGNINLLLLDAAGTHLLNMSPGCPWEVHATVH
jgi:hypothetical protein